MFLPLPVELDVIEEGNTNMNDNEMEFAKLLLHKNMVVYREPKIESCNSIPDFSVYNPRTCNGKLVEITLSSIDKAGFRKEKQIKNLKSCGIPFVVLYGENMEIIKRYSWENIF